ncbi:hypothetical protein ACFU3E_09655 [Streptomyces sp. NPDC057424]
MASTPPTGRARLRRAAPELFAGQRCEAVSTRAVEGSRPSW